VHIHHALYCIFCAPSNPQFHQSGVRPLFIKAPGEWLPDNTKKKNKPLKTQYIKQACQICTWLTNINNIYPTKRQEMSFIMNNR